MGVEYTHGIFVADLDWRPTWKHVEAVRAVLKRWQFDDEVSYRADGVEIDERAAKEMPNGLRVIAAGPVGNAATRLMGPSQSRTADAARNVCSAELHLGSDLKITQVEGAEVDVTSPPFENGMAIEVDEDFEYPFVRYRASWSATPPTTSGENGSVWRCGVILDCGKDIPAIAEPMDPLPSSFVRELEAALSTELVEIGWLH